jgi:hypothetical protein
MTRVYASSVIEAPPERVWAVVRDFNGLADWHPAVASSRIENGEPADKVGCIRNFAMRDGGVIREQLLALSDFDYTCSYSILSSPMGVRDYRATLRLVPVTDGRCTFVEWSADFACAPDREAALTRQIRQDVFQAGFDALKRHLSG